MKIESKKFVDFMKEIEMNVVKECLLDFREEGLYIQTVSPDNTTMVVGTLKKEAFTDYVAIGKLAIDELNSLTKIFKNMGKEFELNIEGNLMTVNADKKNLKFELMDENSIQETDVDKEYPCDTKCEVPVDTIRNFINDIMINANPTVIIKTGNDTVSFTNDGKYKFNYNVDSKDTKEGSRTKLGEPFFNVFANIKEGNVRMNIKTDSPLVVFHDTDDYNVKFVMAPRVENDE